MSQPNGASKPPATSTALPSTARPYRRFILPSLHRRFTNAALLSLTLCAFQALWMGHYESFWHLVALTALRTLLLFVSVLAIYVLRVANLHVGPRISTSPFHSFLLLAVSFETLKTFLWYCFSAAFYCEVYIWSSSTTERLSIVEPGRSWERPRLNGRPIFLRAIFLCLATAQAAIHLYYDYDSVSIPILKPQTTLETLQSQSQQAFWIPLLDLKKSLASIASRSFFRTIIATFIAPVAYWIFIHHTAWSWAYQAARLVFDLPKSSRTPPSFPPLVVDLLGRFFLEGLLLMLGWELANSAFNSYLAREPLKQGRLLTDESQDPNGSLINGLKTSRQIPRSFAFWELVLISQHMEARRQTLYSEINRQGGSTWSQVLTVCLGELHAVVKRIQTFQSPPPPPSTQATEQPLHRLPKISVPVKQDNIFRTNPPPPRNQALISSSNDRVLTASGTKLLTYTADAALSVDQQAHISKSGLFESVQSFCKVLLRSTIGIPFRRTFARRASSIALTTPQSNLPVIVSSVTALTKLIVHSKKEDNLGQVWRDIANVIRTLASTHDTIEMFIKRLAADWTDVYFAEPRRVKDLETVLDALRQGLKETINEFGEYRESLGLSAAELRHAKEIAAKGEQATNNNKEQ